MISLVRWLTAVFIVTLVLAGGAVGVTAPQPATASSGGASSAPASSAPSATYDDAARAQQKPKGKKSQWKYGYPHQARWNPCKPIRWAYNPRGGYKKSLKHTKKAFKRVKKRTGLPLVYAGKTKSKVKPWKQNPRGIDIVVRWANAKQIPLLKGNTAGYGGGLAGYRGSPGGAWEAYNGFIVLDKGAKGQLRKGFAKSGYPTWGQLITHEILHVVGLDHVNKPTQLMNPVITHKNHQFGKGDIQGMKKIGAKQGCHNRGMR